MPPRNGIHCFEIARLSLDDFKAHLAKCEESDGEKELRTELIEEIRRMAVIAARKYRRVGCAVAAVLAQLFLLLGMLVWEVLFE
jgi:hypothetical protein